MRTSFLLGLLLCAVPVFAAAPPDLWPLQPDAATIQKQLTAAKSLSPELQPAVEFQRVFAEIISGAPLTSWRADLEKLARNASETPVSQGVREAARGWLARVWMEDIDAALKVYYAQHVSFPETLDGLGKLLPENLRVDPWGKPWIYSLHAPTGFERQTNQRYQLATAYNPNLGSLRQALKKRQTPAADWKVTLKEVGGARSLEFKSVRTSALIEPGGTVDGCVLMYIGDGWALLAGADQLFTIPF